MLTAKTVSSVQVIGHTGHPLLHEASLLAPPTWTLLGLSVLSSDFPVTGTLLIVAPDQKLSELKECLRQRLSAAEAGIDSLKAGISELPNCAGLALKILSKESRTAKAIIRESAETVRSHFLSAKPPFRRED